jgi:RND family efflux transporter MFP subunit
LEPSTETTPSGGRARRGFKKFIILLILLGVAGGLAWLIHTGRVASLGEGPEAREELPAPVEVAPIERGPIVFRRTFSGTLEATAEFIVAPKISGRIQRLSVDLADSVERGQLVVELDDREYVQAVTQAEADLAVAQATLAEANSTLDIAQRELARVETLRERGIASESQFDIAKTEQLSGQARLEVARAQLQRAESSLESARIRLAYTKVNAEWNEGSDSRVVAERFVDEGDTVSENAPLLTIVELSPITGVIYVTESDYARFHEGQSATLATDAYPNETFEGKVARVSPIFQQTSRQARVELVIDNPDRLLKPGMFIRVTLELARVEDAVIVPEAALATRADVLGIFVLDDEATKVSWRPVTVGLRENGRVQVEGDGLGGRVVTLGQQLIDDGSEVIVAGEATETAE